MVGLFILSLDTEIAWGTNAASLPRYAHCFDTYPDIIRRLIALLDSYEIPATWAVVSQLLLPADDTRASKHIPSHWYHAPYLLDALRGTQVKHEIGTHTFSHIYTHDAETTADVWRQELDAVAGLHREHGLVLRSIVYPRNQVAYTDTLNKYGIIAYRGIEQNWYGNRRGAFHLLDRALGLPPPTYDPAALKVADKLVNLPASQFLMAYDGVRGKIPTASRVRQARFGLDQAVRRNHLYHLWFHPFNLGTSDKMFDALEQILQMVAHRRDAGQLRVMTMEGAAERILGGMKT
jgi:peptidoglycan/xylan/chitin deacetylase (PgdA/CDA1 family)